MSVFELRFMLKQIDMEKNPHEGQNLYSLEGNQGCQCFEATLFVNIEPRKFKANLYCLNLFACTFPKQNNVALTPQNY